MDCAISGRRQSRSPPSKGSMRTPMPCKSVSHTLERGCCMNTILELARPDILTLQPYQHAAWEPSLERMHANEMPWRASGDTSVAGLNRYPEPQPTSSSHISHSSTALRRTHVLAGRGSDEGIDLLVRAFCRAGQDSVLICPPTFGMYKVSARIQGAGVVEVPLLKERGFALDARRGARCVARGREARVPVLAEQSHGQSARPRRHRVAVRAAARQGDRGRRRGLHRVRPCAEPDRPLGSAS